MRIIIGSSRYIINTTKCIKVKLHLKQIKHYFNASNEMPVLNVKSCA